MSYLAIARERSRISHNLFGSKVHTYWCSDRGLTFRPLLFSDSGPLGPVTALLRCSIKRVGSVSRCTPPQDCFFLLANKHLFES